MLSTLYPEKWLPYRYLWPFLRSWWDTEVALKTISNHVKDFPILCLVADKDEVVTAMHGDEIMALCKSLHLEGECRRIPDALHTEVMSKEMGRVAVQHFIRRVVESKV